MNDVTLALIGTTLGVLSYNLKKYADKNKVNWLSELISILWQIIFGFTIYVVVSSESQSANLYWDDKSFDSSYDIYAEYRTMTCEEYADELTYNPGAPRNMINAFGGEEKFELEFKTKDGDDALAKLILMVYSDCIENPDEVAMEVFYNSIMK